MKVIITDCDHDHIDIEKIFLKKPELKWNCFMLLQKMK